MTGRLILANAQEPSGGAGGGEEVGVGGSAVVGSHKRVS